jgi:zinc transporter, ZIP family
MALALIYGAISGFALILGTWVGIFFKLKQKTIAKIMAFGSGVLICALTFGLMEESFKHGGFDAVIIGFFLGGLAYIAGDQLIHVYTGRQLRLYKRRRETGSENGLSITLGAVLDGVPESVALGIALFNGGSTGLLMLTAIFLSNFPESISSVNFLYQGGFSKKRIFTIWGSVSLITVLVTVISFIFLHDLNLNMIGILESFAAGAILAMLSDSMMPEAYKEGGYSIGILTVLGFLTAFIIAKY